MVWHGSIRSTLELKWDRPKKIQGSVFDSCKMTASWTNMLINVTKGGHLLFRWGENAARLKMWAVCCERKSLQCVLSITPNRHELYKFRCFDGQEKTIWHCLKPAVVSDPAAAAALYNRLKRLFPAEVVPLWWMAYGISVSVPLVAAKSIFSTSPPWLTEHKSSGGFNCSVMAAPAPLPTVQMQKEQQTYRLTNTLSPDHLTHHSHCNRHFLSECRCWFLSLKLFLLGCCIFTFKCGLMNYCMQTNSWRWQWMHLGCLGFTFVNPMVKEVKTEVRPHYLLRTYKWVRWECVVYFFLHS